MHTLSFYLQLGIPLSSLFVAIVYFFYNRKKGLFQRLLSLHLFITSMGLLVSFIAINDLFVYVPHLLRTGFLFALLVPPMLYITFYNGLLKKPFRKNVLLHFMPVTLYIINYFSYYIKSAEEKVAILEQVKLGSFSEGWIFPPYFVPILSFMQTTFYIILFVQKSKIAIEINTPKSILQLMRFLIYYMVIHYSPVLLMVFNLYDTHAIDSWIAIIYAVANIIFFCTIISFPEWLFANDFNLTIGKNQVTEKNSCFPEKMYTRLTPNLIELSQAEKSLLNVLHDSFQKNKLFLDADFNQKKLANLLQTSEYKIRILLEKAYGLNFVEYNNLLKIKYLIENYPKKRKTWKRTKIENLATELGYKSLNSFYINFKKIVGITPGEYFKQQDGMVDNNKVKVETV